MLLEVYKAAGDGLRQSSLLRGAVWLPRGAGLTVTPLRVFQGGLPTSYKSNYLLLKTSIQGGS